MLLSLKKIATMTTNGYVAERPFIQALSLRFMGFKDLNAEKFFSATQRQKR
jgi:hypothetical protein